MLNLFGAASKKLDPIEQAKEWKRKIQHESRSLDRDIEKIKHAEQKALIECKKLAKQGQLNAAKILAREVANARGQQERLHVAKTQLNSVSMQLQTSVATMKMGACMTKSAEIMGVMNNLINLPELRETMSTMSREMMKTGLIDEMMDDTFASTEADGIDAEADREVDRIMTELTADILKPAGQVPSGVRKPAGAAVSEPDAAPAEADDSAELEEMQRRLQALS